MEQQGRVKAAAPDEKQLKELEKKVAEFKKGNSSKQVLSMLLNEFCL